MNHINDKVLLSSLVDVVVFVVVVIVAVVLDDTAVLVITHFSCFRCILNDIFQSRPDAITQGFPDSLVVVPFHHPRCFHPHLLQSPSMQVSSNKT